MQVQRINNQNHKTSFGEGISATVSIARRYKVPLEKALSDLFEISAANSKDCHMYIGHGTSGQSPIPVIVRRLIPIGEKGDCIEVFGIKMFRRSCFLDPRKIVKAAKIAFTDALRQDVSQRKKALQYLERESYDNESFPELYRKARTPNCAEKVSDSPVGIMTSLISSPKLN